MNNIWEKYDFNAEVGMEDRNMINLTIDGRVLLGTVLDTKVAFMDNGKKKNSGNSTLTGILVTFKGTAADGSSHEYNMRHMGINEVWFTNRKAVR